MKALDELRRVIGENTDGAMRYSTMRVWADNMERELAERWMELPLDADGVPIRVGDKLEHTTGRFTFIADSLEMDQWGAHVRPNGQARVQCANCRHAKPVTAESLLREFAEEYGGIRTDGDELIAEYAAKLREWKEER